MSQVPMQLPNLRGAQRQKAREFLLGSDGDWIICNSEKIQGNQVIPVEDGPANGGEESSNNLRIIFE